MATKSGAQQNKILRVGIIQNGRIIEERLLPTRQTVTVGQKLRNTFVIASSAFPPSFNLFEAKGDGYVLNVTDKMGGRISLGDSVFDLNALRQSGKARKTASGWQVDLSQRSRGKVVLGDVTILFQFVNQPPLRVLPQLPANMRGGIVLFVQSVVGLTGTLFAALLLSLIAQVGFIVYLVLMVPPPPRPSSLENIPDRFIEIAQEQEPPEEQELDDAETDPDADGEAIAEEADEPAEDEGQEESNEPSSEEVVEERYEGRTQEEIRVTAQEVVRQESALSAFYGGEDGDADLGLSITNQLTSRNAEETLARQQAIGEGGGEGIVSATGLATSGGAEGPVDRMGIDTGGSQIAEGDQAQPSGTEEAETVEVSGSVRVEDSRTAGTGSLDQSSLQRTLRRRRRDIQRCYERGLARNPDLEGRVVVQFTINGQGRVEDVDLRENELGSSVGNCISGEVRRWRFDEPDGGDVVVRTPYIFEPSN